MNSQKELELAWAKMALNTSVGFPPKPVIPTYYDENNKLQITEEGKKRLEIIQKVIDKHLKK